MSDNKETHRVIHKSLYLRVDGKIQQMEEGAELTLSEKQAKKMEARGMIEKIVPAKKKNIGGKK